MEVLVTVHENDGEDESLFVHLDESKLLSVFASRQCFGLLTCGRCLLSMWIGNHSAHDVFELFPLFFLTPDSD